MDGASQQGDVCGLPCVTLVGARKTIVLRNPMAALSRLNRGKHAVWMDCGRDEVWR